MSLAEQLIDQLSESMYKTKLTIGSPWIEPRKGETIPPRDLSKMAVQLGGKAKAIRGTQKRFEFPDKNAADSFARISGGKVLSFKGVGGEEDWYEVRINEAKISAKEYAEVAKSFVSEFKDDILSGEDIESQVADWAKAHGVDGDYLFDAVLKEIKKRGLKY